LVLREGVLDLRQIPQMRMGIRVNRLGIPAVSVPGGF